MTPDNFPFLLQLHPVCAVALGGSGNRPGVEGMDGMGSLARGVGAAETQHIDVEVWRMPLLELRGVSRRFGGVAARSDVDLFNTGLQMCDIAPGRHPGWTTVPAFRAAGPGRSPTMHSVRLGWPAQRKAAR